MLNDLLNKDRIMLNIVCENWEDAIKTGTKILLNDNCITKNYEEAIINNFKSLGPYMVIAPGIVLAHARPENGVKKLSMSLITLKNPINFGSELNDPVKLIITLAAIDSKTHLEALSQLINLLMNTNDLNIIINAKSKEEVLNIINKYSIT
ncbi:PTS sugar transporter subunit IIA [Caloramator australicus]|uniref:Ascorbate-specific PTS system EIIA component n=1 Tax=Caloramator australicus RC3 TaxID=857293 RepID=G0V3T6_9CLOT|nr:PTS sugar transporter subunit IIA [Caloramator australicus]CCC57776.1 Phosphotransferase system mannitol/fructose-specific IIA domain [Caloramator australicus RC3]